MYVVVVAVMAWMVGVILVALGILVKLVIAVLN